MLVAMLRTRRRRGNCMVSIGYYPHVVLSQISEQVLRDYTHLLVVR